MNVIKPLIMAVSGLFFCLMVLNAKGQSAKCVIKNKQTEEILAGITVVENGKPVSTVKDGTTWILKGLASGTHLLRFSYVGFESLDTSLLLPQEQPITIYLTPSTASLEEVTVVSSTRSNQRIENSPLKVEVLGKEEMEEENTIKPANIASILGDVSGVQIQQSSAVSGNANVRIQGLDGRYTQLVRDGMPLFDGFSGGFGVMQIPPLDLKQIELIKGSASTLYGGGAIGGLVNLISKRPGYNKDAIMTLNQTTLKETNLNGYVAKRNKQVGYNLYGGITSQKAVDVNKDGFSDAPKIDAIVVHPRFFLYPSTKTTLALGYTGTFETRRGGDMELIEGVANGVHQFVEENKTNRQTTDLIAEHQLNNGAKLEFKSSISLFNREITTNIHYFNGNQTNYYNELSLYLPKGKASWVMGLNATGDAFKINTTSNPVYLKDVSNNTVGAFAQLTHKVGTTTTIEAGMRTDNHDKYGFFALPRVAIFHRFNPSWATRWGVGLGYKTPNALAAQNKDYNIQDLQPLPSDISAEKSVGYNAELNYKKDFDSHHSLFINQAFFLTNIYNPVIATTLASGQVAFGNAHARVSSKGSDTYIKLSLEDWELYAGYTFTIAEKKYLPTNQFMPLTPKHRIAFVVMYEIEGHWRFGAEGSFTGKQRREDYTETPSYVFMALLAEKKFGKHATLVLNCENLFDYRQSKEEALYTGSISAPNFKQLWAPIDGRVVNLSFRWKWGQ